MQQDHQLAQSNDLETWTLGQIAVALPGATAVFRAVGLDYCCGGQVTLRDAAAANALDLDKLIVELRTLDHKSVLSPANLDTKTLTETIVTHFHRVHSKEMPELIQLAERVEAVHKDHPAVPTGLAALLQQMLGELTMAEHQEHGGHLEIKARCLQRSTNPSHAGTKHAASADVARYDDA